MLSGREGAELREIEAVLRADDPGLDLRMRAHRARRWWPAGRWHTALSVVSALSAVLCLALGQIGAGLVGVLFAVAVFELRGWRLNSGGHAGGTETGRG
ncbi:MAG TPA: DUF3040 domain-containing protein [Pseudonocardia sp.]|jgi:hypothetical protein